MIWEHGKAILEAILFAAPEPLSGQRIAEIIGIGEHEALRLMADLRADYAAIGRGLAVREVAGGYQLITRPDLGQWMEKLLQPRSRGLSRAALETLAIIAYRQPITRAEMESIRGVKVDSSLETLLDRGLIKDIGRKDAIGRPLLYSTTREFLSYFGLRDLTELPPPTANAADHALFAARMEATAGEARMEEPARKGQAG